MNRPPVFVGGHYHADRGFAIVDKIDESLGEWPVVGRIFVHYKYGGKDARGLRCWTEMRWSKNGSSMGHAVDDLEEVVMSPY